MATAKINMPNNKKHMFPLDLPPIQNSSHHPDYFRIGNPYKPLFPLDPKHGWLENPLNFGMVFTRKQMDFTWLGLPEIKKSLGNTTFPTIILDF